MKPNEYKCEMCGGVFEFGWSDEEAKAEAETNGMDIDDCGVVCDDCYRKTPWGGEAMIDISSLRVGDKVHYQPEHYGPDELENGIIKVIDTDLQKDGVWVVYNCNGEWYRYTDYTAALTNLRDLKLGWRH